MKKGGGACISKSLLGLLRQVYTRSVIEPLPAPDTGDATKAAERQKKKGGKMTDEEIMEKLSACCGNDTSQAEPQLFLAFLSVKE